MRARLKSLHSPDILTADLENWLPDDEDVFGFLLQAMIGPADSEGEESFDILVCSPGWLARDMASRGICSGEHMLFMSRYDYPLLRRYLECRINAHEAPTWTELARKFSRLGLWEFEDYSPAPGTPAPHRLAPALRPGILG